MPDLCGQRARRGRLFAFDANGELIEAPTPAEDAPSSKRAVPSKTGALSSPERSVRSLKESVRSLKGIVPLDLVNSPFPEEAVQSSKRSVRSKTGALYTQTVDGVGAGEARYAALAERSAQTADCLMRRVRRHRATGR